MPQYTSPLLTKSFDAGADIAAYRLLTMSAEAEVQQAAANTDIIVGASTELGAAQGERQDVHVSGIVEVEYGGNVSRGDLLTADANGKAVPASQGLETAVVAGGAAGDIAVAGIDAGDELVSVIQLVGGGTDVTDANDLTSEFSIASDGTINNGGGTDTSGDKLIVVWRTPVFVAGEALAGGVAGDIGSLLLTPGRM